MDCWPADSREKPQETIKDQRKSQSKTKERGEPWIYPLIESGSLSAVTLRDREDRLEWTTLAGNDAGMLPRFLGLRLIPKRESITAFPQNHWRSSHHATASVLQRAEQGARFIRTYYPDIDISADIIRDEIIEDTRAMRALDKFNPYVGSMIEAFPCFYGTRENAQYLAFPMGATYNDLNISPLFLSRGEFVELNASWKPSWTFQTPIEQIRTTVPLSQEGEATIDTIIGVRTLASTSLLTVKPTSSRPFVMKTTEIVQILRMDVDNRRVVDMTLPASTRTLALLVNDTGAIYRCSAPYGDKFIQLLYHSPSSDVLSENRTWKIAPWDDENNCLLLSPWVAKCLDFRTQDDGIMLHKPRRPGEMLISAERLKKDSMIRLATTEEILWVDERNTKRPVFGIAHSRGADRTLSVRTRIVSNTPITFLTSHRNSLVTVYDVSRGDAIRLNVPAYSVPPIQSSNSGNHGHSFLQHPLYKSDGNISILQLSESGAVHILDLHSSADLSTPFSREERHVPAWSEEMLLLQDQGRSSNLDVGPLGMRSLSEINLQAAYGNIFQLDKYEELPEDPEVVYNLLDRMPLFWQESDESIDSMLTTFDVAYRSGPEPVNASRSEVFTESALNSVRGYRALMQDRIPLKQMTQQAPWHMNITTFLRRFIPDMDVSAARMIDNLCRFDLVSDSERPAQSFRRDTEAREQLVLDLSLSSDIFFSRRVQQPQSSILDDMVETMSRATEAMSLKDLEPPPVQFGFLHSTSKSNHYNKDEPVNAVSLGGGSWPLGVRLLVKEWEVGSDPQEYVYDDPYDADTVTHAATIHLRMKGMPVNPSSQGMTQPSMQPQRPPTIVPALALAPPAIITSQPSAPAPRRTLDIARSQEYVFDESQLFPDSGSQPLRDRWGVDASSQQMPSTQVLPGPYGGRPGNTKKKVVAKKRVGGF
ncbi:uncharacterized protein FIBRA_06918 [Fibroporia radiculosa]|uniref:Uncharacterized protein n=1 Tax=Fibroporia radiculosa TaxID=599839 RepID=J4GTV8_9APHY|nr:uncharacterized protein FIBRA_06918 [Fibroporia radiculosa]CCM04730.1 predicted protein [Fibroporia radiculosa]